MKKMIIRKITDLKTYDSYIRSFLNDPDYSDPNLSARIEKGHELNDLLTKKDHYCFSIENDAQTAGIFVFLILSEEKYIEMLLGISRDPDAVEKMLEYLETHFKGYESYFIFNPDNLLFKDALKGRQAVFDTEQQKMFYTHHCLGSTADDVQLLTEEYYDPYLKMHNTDVYWTGKRVIEAADTFRTYIALKDNTVTGYLDVTYCHEENEPIDLFVKEEYRHQGYGRKLLKRALLDNEPKDMRLHVDVDNLIAIHLYESMGFIKKDMENSVTACWNIPE